MKRWADRVKQRYRGVRLWVGNHAGDRPRLSLSTCRLYAVLVTGHRPQHQSDRRLTREHSPCRGDHSGRWVAARTQHHRTRSQCDRTRTPGPKSSAIGRQMCVRGYRSSPSRVCESAYKPDPVEDDHLSGAAVTERPRATYPERIGRAALFLLGLAPDGVYLAVTVTRHAGGLLPHRFTLACLTNRLRFAAEGKPSANVPPKRATRAIGGLLSVALSIGLPRLGVTQRHALWSPDFPRPPRWPRSSRRLASRV